MEAELVGPVTILAHAELLGQASCWGRRRGAPGDARSETATGRDAIDKRSLQTRSHAECTRGLLPSRRPPEAADYLNLPPVAGCRRCEAPDRPTAGCTGGTGRRWGQNTGRKWIAVSSTV